MQTVINTSTAINRFLCPWCTWPDTRIVRKEKGKSVRKCEGCGFEFVKEK